MSVPIDPWLLERLVCPATRTRLRQDGDRLISDSAGLAYPIRDGVPVLLMEAAARVDQGMQPDTIAGVDRVGGT